MKKFALALVGLGFVVGCGGSDASSDSSANEPAKAASEATTFECYTEKCATGREYCILSTINSTTMAATCAPLPANCQGCDCLPEDVNAEWRKHSNTNNCEGSLNMCASSTSGSSKSATVSQITMECHKGGL